MTPILLCSALWVLALVGWMKGSARSCILDRPTDPRILRSSQKRWLAGGFFGRHLDFIEGVALPQIMALIAATFVFGAGMSLTAVGQKFLKELQESLEAEDDSKSTNASPKPIVICGPSGVGKGTLINMLLAEFGDKVGFSVSHTTRKPRSGEVDGTHYHFSTVEEMEKMIAAGEFVEYARVHGNIYGTSKKAVDAVASEGKVCILDIDVQGAKSVSAAGIDAFFLFVSPPSIEELERRLRGRGTEKEEAIQKRMENATMELAQTDLSFWNAKVVNDDKEKAYQSVRTMITENCM